ncbi:MAG: hypothetical protein AAF492_27865, partial [Verrucomicrobiota bacterium]
SRGAGGRPDKAASGEVGLLIWSCFHDSSKRLKWFVLPMLYGPEAVNLSKIPERFTKIKADKGDRP